MALLEKSSAVVDRLYSPVLKIYGRFSREGRIMFGKANHLISWRWEREQQRASGTGRVETEE